MKSTIAVLAAVFATALAAQTPAGPGPGESRPSSRVDQRADSMREQIVHGKQVKSHVRVLVRLKNGNRLTGVVKDGRLVERVDGLRFVDAHAQDAGAGIRLWYAGGTRNYVFVPFVDFASYEVLQKLSARQIEEIEAEMQMAERRAQERQAQQAARATGSAEAPPADGGAVTGAVTGAVVEAVEPSEQSPTGNPSGGATTGKASKAGKAEKNEKNEKPDPAAAAKAQHREWYQLLQDYPPDQGWNQARRDEIARRRVVVGAVPSPSELRFVEVFSNWQQACSHFGVKPTEPSKKK
jgi:hypothetical protein